MRTFGNQNRVRFGGSLHSRGEVDRVANREILHVQVTADVADDDQPGVQPHAHLKIFDAPFGGKFGGIRLDRVEHIERGANPALRIVFVRDGCAEKSQHAIAEQLRNRAFITIDRFAHTPMRARNNLAPIFRVHLFRERGRADNIGEQCGDEFTFALGVFAFRQNFAREILRRRFANRVERITARRRTGRAAREIESTVLAKFCVRRNRVAAIRARARKRLTAVLAEFCIGGIFKRTIRTLHGNLLTEDGARRKVGRRNRKNRERSSLPLG